MSIEEAVNKLTIAIHSNTAAILQAVGGAPTPAKAGRPAKANKATEPKKTGPSKADVVALTEMAVEKHKSVIMPQLRALLTKMGVKKATELDENQYVEYMESVGGLIKAVEAEADDSLI